MDDIELIPIKQFADEREEKQVRGLTDCTKYSEAVDMMFLSTENHVSCSNITGMYFSLIVKKYKNRIMGELNSIRGLTLCSKYSEVAGMMLLTKNHVSYVYEFINGGQFVKLFCCN